MGVTKVKSWAQMQEAVDLAAGYDVDVRCEEFLDGDGVTVALVCEGMDIHGVAGAGGTSSRSEGKYDLQNKYFTDVVKYHSPSGLPEAEEKGRPAPGRGRVPRALDCRGLGSRRPDHPPLDRKAFLIEMEHLAGHDLCTAPADRGSARWACRTRRCART